MEVTVELIMSSFTVIKQYLSKDYYVTIQK